ncbi:MAG: hypothetical protein QXO51_01575 [Halobacteria archaeon]
MDNARNSRAAAREEPVCDDCRRPIRGPAKVRDEMGDLVLSHVRCSTFPIGFAPAGRFSPASP